MDKYRLNLRFSADNGGGAKNHIHIQGDFPNVTLVPVLSIISFTWNALSNSLRINLLVKALFSITTSFLDVIALILFAQLLSSLVQDDPSYILKIADIFVPNASTLKIENIYLIVILLIIFLVLIKSTLILTVNRLILLSLSSEYAKSSGEITENFFRMQINQIKAQPSYEVFLAVNSGIRDIFIVSTSALISIITEAIVVFVVFLLLVINGGLSSFLLAVYFLLSFYLINKYTGTTSKLNSKTLTESNLSAAVTIQAMVESIREIRVFNSLNWFLVNHNESVKRSATAHVNLQYVVFVPKIILESTFVIGIALFTWFKIANGEIATAVVEVGFLVAMGSRIIPSLLRLQFSLHQIKQVVGSSVYTTKLLDSKFYKNVSDQKEYKASTDPCDTVLEPDIQINDVSYKYADSQKSSVCQLSLSIKSGDSVAIVGRTGSGKSTLIDLLLGAIEPSVGSIKISGVSPLKFYQVWEGGIGFVPQSIALIDGTIRENLLLGRNPNNFNEGDYRRALDFAGLSDFVEGRNFGLESMLTRAASELSGGQKQKLGIARAILSRPSILILDEVTSSLDSESESVVNAAISDLKGQVTLVVVAHRLTTIKSLDRIVLLENGSVAAEGTFNELLTSNPTFRSFVKLHEL